MRNFYDLLVWQKSRELTLEIYRISIHFPQHEIFGLTSQVRRAAASIQSNIAEGCGHDSDAEMRRFLRMSSGSASELENLLLLIYDLTYISSDQYEKLKNELVQIRKMLYGFISKLS